MDLLIRKLFWWLWKGIRQCLAMEPKLVSKSLCSSDLPQNCADPPASAFLVMGIYSTLQILEDATWKVFLCIRWQNVTSIRYTSTLLLSPPLTLCYQYFYAQLKPVFHGGKRNLD